MNAENRLPLVLLFLRLSVFLVMFLWTLDKFIRPDHAAKIFEGFYYIGGLGKELFYTIGAVELAIILAFLVGFKKRFSYGAVLIFHAVSTLSSYRQYLDPYDGINLFFFAAWPMLAATYALYALRDRDTLWTIGRG